MSETLITNRLLPIDAVEAKVGFKRSAIYKRLKLGEFPQPCRPFGDKTVRWKESDLDAWINRLSNEAGMSAC